MREHKPEWWSWRCFLFGHDLGGGVNDVEWKREGPTGRALGFYCRRRCGRLFLTDECRPAWIGVWLDLGLMVAGALVLLFLPGDTPGRWIPWGWIAFGATAAAFAIWREG